MNRKNASRVIGKKIKDWKNTLPDDIRAAVEGQVIVTGGCIASMLLGEKVNDFDVYLRSKEAVMRLAKHYVAKFLANLRAKGKAPDAPIRIYDDGDRVRIKVQSAGIAAEVSNNEYQYFEGTSDDEAEEYIEAAEASEDGEPYRPVFITDNSISLAGRLQIIIRFWGDPEKIHENYDFEHCKNYWCDKAEIGQPKLVLRKDSLEALLARELRYTGSLYPICSVFRVRKFIERGWTINAGQLLKMAFQIGDLDLHNVDVLEEQLIGVDTAYFREVIALIRQDREKGKTIDQTYIAQLVDRVF